MRRKDFTTEEIPPGRFPPHGSVRFHIEGNLIRYVATGPFDQELLSAYEAEQSLVVPEFARRGPYLDLTVYEVSAMTPIKVLQAYSDYLAQLKTAGQAPVATAYVLPATVEGAELMAPHFRECYARAGLKFEIFENESTARDWLAARLEEIKA